MIDAVNVPVQIVVPNGSVLFNSTRVRAGCSARHEEGSARFVALKPGVYRVAFNANVSIPTGVTVAPISLDIIADGDAVPGGRMLTTPAAVATPQSVSSLVLIKVYCNCCVSLAVRNTGTTNINVQDANFVITREC